MYRYNLDVSLYDLEKRIRYYPHTVEFIEDQKNCDECGYHLVPINSELWRDRRDAMKERDANKSALSRGNEVLAFLDRKVSLTPEDKRALVLALTYSLRNEGGLERLHHVVRDVDEHSFDEDPTGAWSPEEVPGVYQWCEPEVRNIFPHRYSPLPELSCSDLRNLGYTQKKVPANTSLEDAEINPPVGSVSLEDVCKSSGRVIPSRFDPR